MKLQSLSKDLIGLIGNLLDNQRLAKMLFYTDAKPISQPSINPVILAPFSKSERILPYPFDIEFTEEIRSQLHIYFPRLEFINNEIVENILVYFDIVVHKSIWTILSENNEKIIRPYEIAKEVIYELKDICSFNEMSHLAVNEEFQALRIEAQIIRWNDKHEHNY